MTREESKKLLPIGNLLNNQNQEPHVTGAARKSLYEEEIE